MSWRLGVAAVAAVLMSAGCADREVPHTADARLMFSGDHDFQRVAVNATREVRVSLSNVGRSPLNVLDVWVEDQDGAYQADFDHPGPHDLIPGGECTVRLRFHPRKPGKFPARFVVHSDSMEEPVFSVDLTGIGVDAKAVVAEERIDFGRIELGSEKVKSFTVENSSDLPVHVTPKLVGADRDEFTVEPLTLQPFEKRTVDVRFSPTRVGVKKVALSVTPCDGCVDQVVALQAEGLDRAIVSEPPLIDFGQVPMDRNLTLKVKLHNISTESQEVTGFQFDDETDASFTQVGGATPVMLEGGASREFAFQYSPGHMGIATGKAVFGIGSKRNPTLEVPMSGFGGAPELCVSPEQWTFTTKPVGAKVSVGVTVRNCGSSNSAPLTITDLVIGPSTTGVPGEDQFSLSKEKLPVTLKAGEELNFRIYYEPTRAGEHATTVGIRTNGLATSVARVEVNGSAADHLPCQLEITPGAVDFGTVAPGAQGLLGIKVNNIGTDVCPVKNIEVINSAGEVFSMPGGEIPGVIVYAGYYFSFMVAASPPQNGGSFAGTLKIEVSDPANPVIYVPLTVNSQNSCIVAKPGYLDFGITRPDCPGRPMVTTIENVCTTPVTVTDVQIGPGTTDGQFRVEYAPPMPVTLQPGEDFDIKVHYEGTVNGMNLSPLFVTTTGLTKPFLVSLIGEASEKGDMSDTFVQQDGSKVDVLFVVDNTASMVEEHPKLVQAIPSFINGAESRNVDLHVAVTTTGIDAVSNACPGGAQGGEAGRFFPVDNSTARILTLNTPNVTQLLQQNVQVGECAIVEQGFEAMKYALSQPLVNHADDPRTAPANDGNAGFLRDEAALAVIFVGDEDDHSPDPVQDYVNWLRELKGRSQPQRSVIYAIAPTSQACSTAGGSGLRYSEAATRTGGDVLNICASDYSSILSQVAAKAFAPQDTFALSAEPEPGSLRVFVDGNEKTSGWTYDGNKNQIVFSSMPAAGATIEAKYQKACQTPAP